MFTYKSIDDTAVMLDSDKNTGLSREEARRRLEKNGANQLREPKRKNLAQRFLDQLADPLIYVLLAAAAISLFLHEVSDALIILVVVMLNAVTGLIQEGKAKKALDSLKKLTSPKAYVIRSGKEREIDAADLVVGDLICLEAGAQVPADLRLMETENLKIEESALTGESIPVEKDAAFLPNAKKTGFSGEGDVLLGDRKNMAYMSSIVAGGRGMGMVTATGMNTEIGKIAAMIHENKTEATPLQKRLGELGKWLSMLSLLLCVLLFFIAIFQRQNIPDMLLTAISLAVAAVPEGLPAVVTICLALSVTKMVKVNTIIRRLPSVETLGAVSVVCSDKTGTLTQNKMTVTHCYMNGKLSGIKQISKEECRELLEGMTLCNDAVLTYDTRIGDPTELALLEFTEAYGINREKLEKRMPRVWELSFDSKRKMMSTGHKGCEGNAGITVYTKGAPDILLSRCNSIWQEGEVLPMTAYHREQIKKAVEEMSGRALRTLALAKREYPKGAENNRRTIQEENMIFVGMVGMEDPARPEAAGAVKQFRDAGVETVMITGDHVETAYAVASQLGIVEDPAQCMTGEELQQLSEEELSEKLYGVRVFARVSPEHKVRIVRGFQKRGNIVAMTGDGVNDAPSLKAADVGVAMGQNGTDVARQASDMILTDDNFATIKGAIEEGRGVYENIKKSVIFLLSSNLGEIITMFLAVLCGFAVPLRSSHILWINLLTDSLPALALGIDQNDGEALMKKPPRKAGESLFAEGGLACTCFYGCLIAAISLAAYLFIPYGIIRREGMAMSLENFRMLLQNGEIAVRSQTYAFTVLGISQLFHAVGMRNVEKSVFVMKHRENKLMMIAFVLGFVLQFAVTEIPFLIGAFQTVHLSATEWMRLAGLAAFPMISHEILVFLKKI